MKFYGAGHERYSALKKGPHKGPVPFDRFGMRIRDCEGIARGRRWEMNLRAEVRVRTDIRAITLSLIAPTRSRISRRCD